MALIALVSAKGSPGVTTTSLALTLQWPRPALMVEADLAGSSILSGFFRGQVAHDRGLGPLAIAHSHDELDARLWEQAIQIVVGDPDKKLIPGVVGPHAAPAVSGLWSALAHRLVALEHGGVDVIVDLGRYGVVRDDREIIVRLADQVLMTTGSRLPDIAVARDAVRTLLATSDDDARDLTNLAALTIGPGRPYDTAEIARVLGVPDAGGVLWDPVSADVLSTGSPPTRRYRTSPFVRSIGALADTVRARAEHRRAQLTTSRTVVGA
jgi:hypothetical protein